MHRHAHRVDKFAKEAKKLGYPARSVFKLEEIDKKHKILQKGSRIIDLGCSPGSWSKFACKQIGADGCILGLDLTYVDLPGLLCDHDNVHLLQMDVMKFTPSLFQTLSPEYHLKTGYDLLMSDMAPNTIGHRDVDAESCLELVLQALYIASLSVKPNGKILTKVFQQGNSFDLAQKAFRTVCKSHVICKPQAARKESMEWFILGSGIQARPFDKAKFIQKHCKW